MSVHSGRTELCAVLTAFTFFCSPSSSTFASETASDAVVDIDFSGLTYAGLSIQERDLLKECRDNYIGLKAFYGNVTIEASGTMYGLANPDNAFPAAPGADLQITGVKRYVFRARDREFYRLDRTNYDIADQSQAGESEIGIITPNESHLFGKARHDGKAFLIAHGKNRDEYLSELGSFLFLQAPFSNWTVPLEYQLFRDRTPQVMERITLRDELGEQVASIAVAGQNGTGTVAVRVVYDFYRNRSWALKGIEEEMYTLENPERLIVRRQQCVYREGRTNEIPILRECIFENSSKERGKPGERVAARKVFEITRFTPGRPELAEFDVNQFIGTRIGQKTEPLFNFRVIFVLNGIVLLFIGLWLRRSKKKRHDANN